MPVLATLDRDGVLESVHRGHLAVVDTAGAVLVAHGRADVAVYVRSSAKPFQTLAVLERLDGAGVALDAAAIAISSASHAGADDHQIEAARVLALADLDESALRCPADLPTDVPALLDQRTATRLAHNCSGKHAAFLYAHTANGGAPSAYLHPDAPLQRCIRRHLEACFGVPVQGPAVDGCGAPAWIAPLTGLGTGFARLAEGRGDLGHVADAMRAHPVLVGGRGIDDTELMLRDARIVAKRGAEGVLAAGFRSASHGPLGVVVKVEDGASRAAGPVVAAALEALGAVVPDAVRRRPVLGGGERHGWLRAVDAVAGSVTEALGVT